MKPVVTRGEKYEAMWEELCHIFFAKGEVGEISHRKGFTFTWSCQAFEIMNKIKQKFFPK